MCILGGRCIVLKLRLCQSNFSRVGFRWLNGIQTFWWYCASYNTQNTQWFGRQSLNNQWPFRYRYYIIQVGLLITYLMFIIEYNMYCALLLLHTNVYIIGVKYHATSKTYLIVLFLKKQTRIMTRKA